MLTNSYEKELTLLEQVHLGLSSASKFEDFYVILASMLVDPNMFRFSRAFFLRYDERAGVFTGRLALGASTEEEHEEFRRELLMETQQLKDQVAIAQKESPEPHSIQNLYDLRFHSVWIRLLQGEEEGTGLNAEFRSTSLRSEDLSESHFLERVVRCPNAQIFDGSSVILGPLSKFLRFPLVAGRLITKRGLHGVLIADSLFEEHPADQESLYHFQWLINHASVALDNVELVEELTTATRRMQEVDRLKTNFLSIVSHEFRTPLTSIVGFAHLLGEEKVGAMPPAQRELLGRVMQHALHLQSMVNDLLEIAEVEAGGIINVHLVPVDPLAALLNTIPKIEARRGKKDVDIEPIIGKGVPLIKTDENALERIFYHLLDNAVKFTSSGGTVKVRFDASNGDLDIAIIDSGIGISQEHLKRIFDYFYQVDFRLERAYGGMGIGLTVVKLLLEATGGKISVDSSPQMGSRFTLTYPVAQAFKPSKAAISMEEEI